MKDKLIKFCINCQLKFSEGSSYFGNNSLELFIGIAKVIVATSILFKIVDMLS